jgi:hypothetical protein
MDKETMVFPGNAAGYLETGDSGDRAKSLSAEAEGGKSIEIIFMVYFTCGMRFNAELYVLAVHSRTIINDPDGINPPPGNIHIDIGSTGINRVIQKLTKHGKRPVDYLAGRYFSSDGTPEEVNPPGGFISSHNVLKTHPRFNADRGNNNGVTISV